MQQTLAASHPPPVEPGDQCAYPHECEFRDICQKALPPDHVSFLPHLSAKQRKHFIKLNVEWMEDIPHDFPLTVRQRIARKLATKRSPHMDKNGLTAALAKLKYPAAYLDFETMNPAIPRYRGMSPFDVTPPFSGRSTSRTAQAEG